MGFSRQEYWSRLPCPAGNHPDAGIEAASPVLAGEFFTTSATWEAPVKPCCLSTNDNVYKVLAILVVFFHILKYISSPDWRQQGKSEPQEAHCSLHPPPRTPASSHLPAAVLCLHVTLALFLLHTRA